MRVQLAGGIATGGGTTKFHDVFLEPGTTQQRLFRKNDAAAETTPWYDKPAEIGIAPDGGAGNPADPRLPWQQHDPGRPGPVRRRPQRRRPAELRLQLLRDHAAARRARRRRSSAARSTPRRRRRRPPSRRTRCAWRASTSRTTSRSARRTTATSSRRPSTTSAPRRSCTRSRTGSARRTWSPMQEVAVFADGANALTGLATGARQLHGLHHDQQRRPRDRDRLPGQGRHDGDQRPAASRDTVNGPWASASVCDLYPGKLFDRAPYALDLKKGDLSLHGAEQPLRVAVASDAVPHRRGGVRPRQRGRTLQQDGQERARGGRPQRLRVLHAAADADPGRRAGQPLVRRAGRAGVLVQVQRAPADAGPHRSSRRA